MKGRLRTVELLILSFILRDRRRTNSIQPSRNPEPTARIPNTYCSIDTRLGSCICLQLLLPIHHIAITRRRPRPPLLRPFVEIGSSVAGACSYVARDGSQRRSTHSSVSSARVTGQISRIQNGIKGYSLEPLGGPGTQKAAMGAFGELCTACAAKSCLMCWTATG